MIIFARNYSVAKYLEKKLRELEKLSRDLAIETARTTDCQNSCAFMEAH